MYRFPVAGEFLTGVVVGAADRIWRTVRAEISQHAKKGMNGFVIDFALEMPYPLAPPQGREVIFGL